VFQKRRFGETFISGVLSYNITRQDFQSGIFEEKGLAQALDQSIKHLEMGIDEFRFWKKELAFNA
jgi:hypothetical protein